MAYEANKNHQLFQHRVILDHRALPLGGDENQGERMAIQPAVGGLILRLSF